MTCGDPECAAREPHVRRLPGDVRDELGEVVLVFAHRDRRGAEASAACNRDHFGHPARAELRESVGWVSIVDLRPAIARLRDAP